MIIINRQEVDITSLTVEDVSRRDFPKFTDAFLSAGKYTNGNNLSGKELEQLEEEDPDLVNQLAIEWYWDIGI